MKENKMKKLMIAAAIVCAAAMAQASAFSWETAIENGIALPGATYMGPAFEGTVYLFANDTTGAGATTTRAAMLQAFIDGALPTEIASTTSDNWGEFSSTANYGAEGDANNFYVVALTTIDGEDAIFIGDLSYGAGQAEGKVTPLTFAEWANGAAAAKDAAGGFQGAGWYTQAVPEPTSGLLLLLGVAGLALRRRRA